jgi:hypothetical protein
MENLDSLNLKSLDKFELIEISGGKDVSYEIGYTVGYVAGFVVFGVEAALFLGLKKLLS